jgi:hypothetical protein
MISLRHDAALVRMLYVSASWMIYHDVLPCQITKSRRASARSQRLEMTKLPTPSQCSKINEGYYTVSMTTSSDGSRVPAWLGASPCLDSASLAARSRVFRHHSSIDSAPPPSILTVFGSEGTPRTVPWNRDSTPVLLCFFMSARQNVSIYASSRSQKHTVQVILHLQLIELLGGICGYVLQCPRDTPNLLVLIALYPVDELFDICRVLGIAPLLFHFACASLFVVKVQGFAQNLLPLLFARCHGRD